MNSLQHTNDITEGAAMEHILGACRANEKRETRRTFGYSQVKFTPRLNGQHLASLYNQDRLLATAVVDQFDI